MQARLLLTTATAVLTTLSAFLASGAAVPASAAVMGVNTHNLSNVCDTTFVASKLNDPTWVILDGRDGDDYAAGHIPGAVSYGKTVVTTLKHPADGRVASVARAEELLGKIGVSNEKKLIVYGTRGDYHVTVEQYPIYLGVKDFCYLDGGFEAWVADGRPVSTAEVKPTPATFKANIANPKMYLSTEELIPLVRAGAKGMVFVDTRSAKEFSAEENTVIRGGRIPGAINVDVKANLDPKTGKLLPLDQLEKVYAKVPRDQTVVLYCHRGCRTGYAFYALNALGYKDVKVYEDGFVVWGNRHDTPIENEHYFNLRPFASRLTAVENANEALEAKVAELEAALAKLRGKTAAK
jgi:thiosulfate/3-mercaptopyruvate sulfurtransferase